jgi:peptidoglycan/xylan/chitin deacetylase (PgdA/CDA1 family)
MHTQVCITIDTEFSIAGAFGDPHLNPVAEPFVWCEVDGRSEGLGFLLACFRKYRIAATFFVEAMHRHYFVHDPMRPVVHRIQDDGHEIQLHIHPCWSVFQHPDWRERVRRNPRQDDFFGRDEEDSLSLLRQGAAYFHDWGLPMPQVFRSGSLQHDDALYRALARSGIPYSSNIGVAVFDGGDPQYKLYAGRHRRHGVVECPILTYSDWNLLGKRHLKSLTISGTSFAETRALLEKARLAGIPLVVILTHPFEYIQSRDVGLRHSRRHGINQARLTRLCEFLDNNRDKYSPVGLAEAASRPMETGHAPNPLLEGALWQTFGRMVTQVSYDRFGDLALATKRRAVQ